MQLGARNAHVTQNYPSSSSHLCLSQLPIEKALPKKGGGINSAFLFFAPGMYILVGFSCSK